MTNPIIEKAVALIEAQQAKVQARSPQWMVGEQLKDICRQEPRSAELIAQDLQVEAMSITEAEKKIKAFADKNKTGGFACVTPAESDRILREFYGLPAATEDGEAGHRDQPDSTNSSLGGGGVFHQLEDFF